MPLVSMLMAMSQGEFLVGWMKRQMAAYHGVMMRWWLRSLRGRRLRLKRMVMP
jgi:hypothetical protein